MRRRSRLKKFDKGKRLEQLILDFTKWLDKNYKTVTVEDIKKYWKKLIEDYAFEQVAKVIEILGGKNPKPSDNFTEKVMDKINNEGER